MKPTLLRIKKSIQRTYRFEEAEHAREFIDLLEGFEVTYMSHDCKTIILEELIYDEFNNEGVVDRV